METSIKKRNKRKLLFIVLFVLLAIALSVAGIMAFFSDTVTSSDSTIKTGTLSITTSGAIAYKLNGTTAVAASLSAMHPGDVAVISIPVKNNGSHSAWLRGNVTLTGPAAQIAGFNGMFEVFKDEWTQANVTAAAATAKKLTLVASGTSFVWSESTQTEYYVINGDNTTTSFDAETDGANGVNGNTILNSGARQNEGNMIYTIYYKPIADNSYQDKSFNFQFKVQALQLRNNASPDWTGIN